MNHLSALAYVSSATHLLSESELEALLVSARTANHEHGVTGVLLYDNGSFFQYLEGAPSAVAIVYERIKASRQHHGIIELDYGLADARHFGSWHMGFSRSPRSIMLSLSQSAWTRAAATATEPSSSSAGVALLLEFWMNGLRDA